MSNETVIIPCASCGVKNRIPVEKISQKPVCGKCKAELPHVSSSPVVVTDKTFDTVVAASSLPVLVDFWAPWCSPCRMMEPTLKKLAEKFSGKLLIVKMNVDQNPIIASRYTVMSVPTLIFLKNGVILQKIPGALPSQELERQIQQYI